MCKNPVYTLSLYSLCHLGYQGTLILQVSLYDKAPFGSITKCVDYLHFQVS